MKDFSPNTILIPLMTMLAIYLPFSASLPRSPEHQAPAAVAASPVVSGSSSDDTNGSGDRRAAKPTVTPDHVTKLLCRYFGQSDKTCTAASLPDEARNSIESMIVAVPDPKESRFGYLFDRHLDAIQRAVEAAGYVLDGFDFPWQDTNSRISAEAYDTAKTEKSDSTVKGKEEKVSQESVQTTPATPRYQREPGLVLFRHNANAVDEQKKLLLLMLVSEMPTTGVRPMVLANALEHAGRWTETSASCETPAVAKTLRLLAPFFSGSQDSWKIGLQNWGRPKPRNLCYSMISGTAMSVTETKFSDRQRGRFQSTALPLSFAIEEVKNYLNGLENRSYTGGAPYKIALLVEGNTSFGQNASKPTSQTGLSCPTPTPNSQPIHAPKVLTLPFPLHISQLRTASEKVKPAQNGSPLELPGMRRPLLPLLLEDTRDAKDVLPLYSQLEVASAELVLSNTLNEIKRERIRYVGIVATDVKDIIFLVGQVRNHCPNAVPFVFLSDMLYLHPAVNPDLRGTLVVATYPLFAPNQLWTAPFPGSDQNASNDRLQFPSQIAQGVYNATLALLGKTVLMREYGSPYVHHMANDQRRPPLWISMVGAQSFWPVYFKPYCGEYVFSRNAPPLPPALTLNLGVFDGKFTLTLLWLLLVGSLLVTGAALAELVQAKWGEKIEQKDDSAWWQRVVARAVRLVNGSWFGKHFGDPAFEQTYRRERRGYLLIGCASLSCALCAIAWVAFLPRWITVQLWLSNLKLDWEQERLLSYVVLAILLLLAYPVTLWLLYNALFGCFTWLNRRLPARWQNHKHSARIMMGLRMSLALLLPSVLMVAFLARAMSHDENHQVETNQLFFFLRARDFSDGVSPLLPLLLVAIAAFLWAFCEIRRMQMNERLFNPDQTPGETVDYHLKFEYDRTQSFVGYEQLEYSVVYLLIHPLYRVPGFHVVLALLFVPFLYVWFRLMPSVEGPVFDVLFAASFGLVSMVLCLTFLRFVQLWIMLRRMLRRLSYSPFFTRALSDKEKERFPSMPKLSLTQPLTSVAPLSSSIEKARQLFTQLPLPQRNQMAVWLIEAEDQFRQGLAAKGLSRWRAELTHRAAAHKQLAEFSLATARLLETEVWLADSADKKSEADSWAKEAELYLVSRLTAFLAQILEHLQSLTLFVTSGVMLLLLAVTSYPFQPRELLLMMGWILIVFIVAVTLLIFVQMSRDKVLSELCGTTPDKLNWNMDFLFRFAFHGLLPILALLGAQFPELFRQWFGWLSALQGGGN